MSCAVPDRRRAGSPRPAAHQDQAVLRVQHPVRPAAQLGDLPGLPRHARRAAGDEPPRVRPRPARRRWRSTARSPTFTKWDRKNYYYPDLPKNYQISQYDLPFSHDGWLEINAAADPKKEYKPKRIGIIRAHLEEDAGKMLHDETGRGGDSMVDLNRTGTPLLEIVSKPDITRPEEAKAYLEETAADAARDRRLRLRDAGGQPALRRQRQHPRPAERTARSPPRRSSRSRTSTASGAVERAIAVRGRAAVRGVPGGPGNYRFGKMLKTTAGWDDAEGRHRRPAAQGGGGRLPLLPRAGPGARGRGRRRLAEPRGPRWASCRPSSGSGSRRPVRAVRLRRRRADAPRAARWSPTSRRWRPRSATPSRR